MPQNNSKTKVFFANLDFCCQFITLLLSFKIFFESKQTNNGKIRKRITKPMLRICVHLDDSYVLKNTKRKRITILNEIPRK